MPCFCPTCRLRVPDDVDCIACDFCDKWYHFECTKLTKTQFELFNKDKSFSWFCEKCSQEKCKKCNILTKGSLKIKCELCEKNYHFGCAGLNKKSYIYTPWYCFKCNDNIFPFNSLSVKKIVALSYNSLDLSRHPNKLCRLYVPTKENLTDQDYRKICKCRL